MPIYEYRCEECGHELDVLQKVSEPALTDCPECESSSLRKLISAPNFRLKGSGWYETDFKGDKDNKRNLHGSDSEAKPEAKSDEKGSKDKDAAKDGAKKTKADNKPKTEPGGGAKKAEAST